MIKILLLAIAMTDGGGITDAGGIDAGDPLDAGSVSLDAGSVPVDAGSVPVDAGSAVLDAGSVVAGPLPSINSVEDVFHVADKLENAIYKKEWAAAYALLLMFVMALLNFIVIRRLKTDARLERYKKLVPVLTAVAASIPAAATKLWVPGASTKDIILTTVMIATSAIGTYELAVKPVKKRMTKKHVNGVAPAGDNPVSG